MLNRQKYEFLRGDLKKARLDAKLLQIDLAKKLKKPQSYISKVESGERNLDLIEYIDLCLALEINPAAHVKKLLGYFNT